MNVALVTGSSRGIGAACAQALARSGYKVCINCIERMDLAQALAERLREEGCQVICHQADVADGTVSGYFAGNLEAAVRREPGWLLQHHSGGLAPYAP